MIVAAAKDIRDVADRDAACARRAGQDGNKENADMPRNSTCEETDEDQTDERLCR
jgi:hypothetical protein